MYNYLQDREFLYDFASLQVKEQFIKIILLDWKENPIREIQGFLTQGTLNCEGNSAVRRSCSMTIVANEYQNDLTNINNFISVNKKVRIEMGFTNSTFKYTEFDKIWFPLGVFVITSATVTLSKENFSITLQLKDKMCLLNGECGGLFPASTQLSLIDTLDDKGEYYTTLPTIPQIIKELVNHFGGEQLGKIVISDVDNKVKQVMKWMGNSPLYHKAEGDLYSTAVLSGDDVTVYEYGDDVGFVYTDFTYPGELVASVGESICNVLDKIKNTLGNYEYFYDLDGNFIFREKRNFLNTKQSSYELNKCIKENEDLPNNYYEIDLTKGKEMYDLSDSALVLSFQNTPKYEMIKNDFIVWGIRKSPDGKSYPIRYHLAIDKKPKTGNTYEVIMVTEEDTNFKKAKVPLKFNSTSEFPEVGIYGMYYAAGAAIYKWGPGYFSVSTTPAGFIEITYDSMEDLPVKGANNVCYIVAGNRYIWRTGYVYQPDIQLTSITTNNWRTELYMQGVMAEPFGTDSNYYYAELANEWPRIFDIEHGDYYADFKKNPSSVNYYLDFIDTDSAMGSLSVSNIGRRQVYKDDKNANCIFENDIPDVILLNLGDDNLYEQRQECILKGQNYTQVTEEIYNLLAVGGTYNAAFYTARDLLYENTDFNETLNINILPLYYIEPNNLVALHDEKAGVYGNYFIKSISIPLSISGTMNMSCIRMIDKL